MKIYEPAGGAGAAGAAGAAGTAGAGGVGEEDPLVVVGRFEVVLFARFKFFTWALENKKVKIRNLKLNARSNDFFRLGTNREIEHDAMIFNGSND